MEILCFLTIKSMGILRGPNGRSHFYTAAPSIIIASLNGKANKENKS